MKRLSVIFNKAPYGSQAGRELLDIALMAAAFDMEISAIFIEDGIRQLLNNQQPDILHMKSHSPTFKAMELYGIETVLIDRDDLLKQNIAQEQLLEVAKITSGDVIKGHIAGSDFVFML
ncbi:sulfurtransferase complex subunit TusC [Kangiella sediminilitoris]|uniref:Sulfur relay protein DsrF n=1 Tax=Kangiella sediminilitoris TaxID=1144748 RepID=A0A1B3BA25_9GAMM|nr:sulfurtransferase complex subunit TusC [Kangiella sediminilitoris]AOE49625.1 sulfur relay protein DsrF [Kangiella sediminilitoris]